VSRRARRVLAAAVSLVVLAMMTIALPARTWVSQQREVARAEAELAQLDSTNRALARKIRRLSEPAAIERQAREEFGFVEPGEESYTVPPAPPREVTLPEVWPFDLLQESVARAADRAGADR
jgi:cell division protein FtsB